jgi:hypothetical protein
VGAILPLTRRPPLIRGKRIAPGDTESAEAIRSLRLLLWSFGLTAIAMCAIVVAMLSRSWHEMLWIAGFLTVFALLKIALANALFYLMVHYDKDRRTPARLPRLALRLGHTPKIGIQPLQTTTRAKRATGVLRLAPSADIERSDAARENPRGN